MITLAIDPGSVHTGIAVWDSQTPDILESKHFNLEADFTQACTLFHHALDFRLQRWNVDLLVIEDIQFAGRYQPNHYLIYSLIGIARIFGDRCQVSVISPTDWQEAIVGIKPRLSQMSRTVWKNTIRQAVERRLQTEGVVRDMGKDPGGHRFDSLALAIYASDKEKMRRLTTQNGGPRHATHL